MATIVTRRRSRSALLACTVVLLLTAWAAAPVRTGQDRTLPISVRAAGAVTGLTGAPTTVLFRLGLSGLGELEVVRLVRRFPEKDWQLGEITRAPADRLLVRGQPGLDTLLVLRTPAHPGYLLDGPFQWPAEPSTYVISPRWRRTVRGSGHRNHGVTLTWLPGREDDAPADGWPACTWMTADRWECVGVPLTLPGVVVSVDAGQVHYGVASGVTARPGIEEVATADTSWGRLLTVTAAQPTAGTRLADVKVVALQMRAPAEGDEGIREPGVNDSVRVTPVGTGAFWLSGARPRDGWIELRAPGFAPARLPASGIASATPATPLMVVLEPAVAIFGRVMAGPDLPAAGALVRLGRFIHDPEKPDAPPSRVHVATVRANSDGEFQFSDLSMEPYEIIASLPELGHGVRRIDPDGQPIVIDLSKVPVPRPYLPTPQ